MKSKIFSFFKNLLFLVVFSLLLVSLYVINNEIGLVAAFDKYSSQLFGKIESRPEIEKEAAFIKNMVSEYYKIDRNSSSSEKSQFLSHFFDKNIFKKHKLKLDSGLAYLSENNGKQNFLVQKIVYDKNVDMYLVYLHVVQEVEKEKPRNFDIELSIKIRKSDNSSFLISTWDENVLSIPYKKSLSFELNKAASLSLSFPCRVMNVSTTDKRSQLEYKVLADYKSVVFNTNDDDYEMTNFQINCEKIKFETTFSSNDAQSTIYASLNNSDGKLAQRVLTPQEKMTLSIRKQLRSWGLVEPK